MPAILSPFTVQRVPLRRRSLERDEDALLRHVFMIDERWRCAPLRDRTPQARAIDGFSHEDARQRMSARAPRFDTDGAQKLFLSRARFFACFLYAAAPCCRHAIIICAIDIIDDEAPACFQVFVFASACLSPSSPMRCLCMLIFSRARHAAIDDAVFFSSVFAAAARYACCF